VVSKLVHFCQALPLIRSHSRRPRTEQAAPRKYWKVSKPSLRRELLEINPSPKRNPPRLKAGWEQIWWCYFFGVAGPGHGVRAVGAAEPLTQKPQQNGGLLHLVCPLAQSAENITLTQGGRLSLVQESGKEQDSGRWDCHIQEFALGGLYCLMGAANFSATHRSSSGEITMTCKWQGHQETCIIASRSCLGRQRSLSVLCGDHSA